MEEMEELLDINEMEEITNFNSNINNSKLIINTDLHKYLYFLLKKIFLKKSEYLEFDRYLNEWTNKINKKIIKKKEKYLNEDYSINNFNNILDFIKTQNKKYAGDILEGLLINIFSNGFIIDKDKSFWKYLFSNFHHAKDENNFDLCKWFQGNKFKPRELENIKRLFFLDQNYNYETDLRRKNSIFYNILFEIFKTKYLESIYPNKYNNNNNYKYNNSLINNSSSSLYKAEISLNKSFILSNSISNLIFNFDDSDFENVKLQNITIIRPFFISVYIYYQNKNSPLMKYIKSDNINNKKDLANIPFEYNLSLGSIEEKFAPIIFAPLRIEPRITKINLSQNNLGKLGLYELSKTLLFNKNIKIIEYSLSLVDYQNLPFINYGFGIFDNYSVEELNLSNNIINSNCQDNLAKLISHFKGLKTLILSDNTIKSLSSFIIMLKKLYREGKTKLQNLYLKKCLLDETTYYELSELVKCKYCKLKILSLNSNKIPINSDFLKKLKNNKSLKELNLTKNNIVDNDLQNISKIISNSYIRNLYLFKNKISNFSSYLRMFYRTKIIKDKNEKSNIIKKPLVMNLDISNNECNFKNAKHIILLINIVKETSLDCLDISHTLLGHNPEQISKTKENAKYRQLVEELKEYLLNDKSHYFEIIKEILNNKADINELYEFENEVIFRHLNNKISLIINDENSNFPVFIRENVKKLIDDEENIYLRDKIFINNKYNEILANEIEQKLVNYIIVKKANKNLKSLEEEKRKKKLIII